MCNQTPCQTISGKNDLIWRRVWNLSAQQRNEKIDEGSRLDSLQEEVEELRWITPSCQMCGHLDSALCDQRGHYTAEVPGKDSYSGRLGTAI
mmetsp:Transcript_44607/g.71296  ORF Transcript_44607/g.71296 Transcript_44607/m.71296 type:complete len:92 (+) Transcript_44607:929-1204(+)